MQIAHCLMQRDSCSMALLVLISVLILEQAQGVSVLPKLSKSERMVVGPVELLKSFECATRFANVRQIPT